jgi:CRISPR-associated DxTHG motif protein
MKAITFLGTKPSLQKYRMADGREHEAHSFGATLPRFYPGVSLRVFATESASNASMASFTRDVEDFDCDLQEIRIPEGRDQEQLWELFSAMVGTVDDEEEVIFDITHGLRSLPVFGLLAALFLRTARRVKVASIFYGALELQRDGCTPVVDLTPFANLLDWTMATDQFVTTGDARRLAGLVRHSQGVTESGRAAEILENASRAAFLCQPLLLMPLAAKLPGIIDPASPPGAEAQPFGVLRARIAGTFGSFGAGEAAPLADQLSAQYCMLRWYFANHQTMQAVTLGREWLVTAVTWRLGEPLDLARRARSEMENAVSGIARLGTDQCKDEMGKKRECLPADLNQAGKRIYETWSESERVQLKRIWNELSSLRNALDHAGYQQNASKLARLVAKADHVANLLDQLAREWQLDRGSDELQRHLPGKEAP